jgi:uncharacterized protein YdeI (YjbR/CyaY-like superfamily)
VSDDIKFFATQGELRKWLAKNHNKLSEQWIGFYKKGSGRPSITWPESVDEALCFGWIDGLRESIDDEAYKIRFTPRREGSIWSAVNIKRARELVELGLMMPSGLSQFEKRDEARTNRYAYERKNVMFDAGYIAIFKKNKNAWSFFDKQPPGYKHLMTHRVMSAKQEATRLRRLEVLIAESAAGRRMDLLKPER